MTNTTHDADRGAHDYAHKEAHRVSTKVCKAIQYSCELSQKSVKELQQVASRIAYEEAYGHAYRDLLMKVIKDQIIAQIKQESAHTHLKRAVAGAFVQPFSLDDQEGAQ